MATDERRDPEPAIDVRIGDRVVRTSRTHVDLYEAAFVMECTRAEARRRLRRESADDCRDEYSIRAVVSVIGDDGLALAFLARILTGRYVAPAAGSETELPPSLSERLKDLQ